MNNLENNTEEILDQEDDGKTFAGGALFGDDVESEESEEISTTEDLVAEEPKVEEPKVEEPKVEKQKVEKTKKSAPKEEPKPEVKEEEYQEVALHAEANLFKFGLGELKKGYNIVSREHAEFWLKHRKVRIATPKELARYYGKE